MINSFIDAPYSFGFNFYHFSKNRFVYNLFKFLFFAYLIILLFSSFYFCVFFFISFPLLFSSLNILFMERTFHSRIHTKLYTDFYYALFVIFFFFFFSFFFCSSSLFLQCEWKWKFWYIIKMKRILNNPTMACAFHFYFFFPFSSKRW